MSEQNSAPVDHGVLALRAAVAYQVKKQVAAVCDPVIAANSEHIKTTHGLSRTTAELPLGDADNRSIPIGSFSRSLSKPSFYVEDDKALFEYADAQGETDFAIRPSFIDALIGRLQYDAATGAIIDRQTGEIVPGIGYDPGGQITKVSPYWDPAGVEALNVRLGFITELLANLPHLTASDFHRTLEAGQ
ncbi:hypothetical protein [Streptomyces virginiae]|uniref:hypothetical protein n=1 Tax=Streptomyces virginiae TaxID=1961 RepID=UPI003653CE9B